MKLRSIRAHLLFWQVISLLILSLASFPISYWLAHQLSRQIYDEHLLNSADSVVGRIENDREEINVDLPVSARQVLRHQDMDTFYYQVLNANNKLIECDEYIPTPAKRAQDKKPIFYEGYLDGNKVRILEVWCPHPTNAKTFLYVEVAETLNTRQAFARQILLALITTQIIFTAFSVLVIWLSIGRGLIPLKTLEGSLANRGINDLQPLPLNDTPSEALSLVETINRLLVKLNEHIQVQSRFAGNVAHQLRTPLSGVKTFVDIALRNSNEPKVHELLEQINHGVCRLIAVIEKMLILARSEPNLVASQVDSIIDLNGVVFETLSELGPFAKEKQIEFEFSYHPNQAKIFGDAFSLHELIRNVLENSIIYSPAKSTIKISTTVNSSVSLIVEDNGSGIDASERELVFEPFYRSSSNKSAGSGLGLAIVKDIAKAHQATVVIEDRLPERGTRVVVTFPAANGKVEDSNSRDNSLVSSTASK
jgi:two-component system, OmpR family, sensor histidine kinase TctE